LAPPPIGAWSPTTCASGGDLSPLAQASEGDHYFTPLCFSSWYREPDYAPNYREPYELERELSDDNASRFELLSVWRLARDPGYAAWASEVGTEAC